MAEWRKTSAVVGCWTFGAPRGGDIGTARIKGNTAKARVTSKITVDGLFRTEEEKRKLANRVAVTRAALEDLDANPTAEDAPVEIDDDWLNFFVRASEDKSSEELQQLFGRILSGEIRSPGSFSLRTVQLMSTIAKREAEALSRLLSYAIDGRIVPFQESEDGSPTFDERFLLEELGIAAHPAKGLGGQTQISCRIEPGQKQIRTASHRGILIQNNTEQIVTYSITGQMLTTLARELQKIANSPATDVEFLKKVARQIHTELRRIHAADMDRGVLTIHFVAITSVVADYVNYIIIDNIGTQE